MSPTLTATPWRERGPALWPAMTNAFDSLAAEHELVILEGAGSPAEINLPDLVNNAMLAHADAAALLVADIDRGGAFAHLYGTWGLVPDATRERLAGFVLNRFRGDVELLSPGPERLTELTGMPCAGIVPMLRHELPDEEGATVRADPGGGALRVAVARFPYGSNLDELHLLGAGRPRHVRRAPGRPGQRRPRRAARFQARRRRPRLAAEPAAWPTSSAAPVCRVLGICGGCQMLGTRDRRSRRRRGRAAAGRGRARDAAVRDGARAREGHRSTATSRSRPTCPSRGRRSAASRRRATRSATAARPVVRCGRRDRCWRPRVHGLLEDPDVVERLVGRRPPPVLEETFDLLADAVDTYLDTVAAAPPRAALTGFSLVSAGRSMLAPCDGARDRSGWPLRWVRWLWRCSRPRRPRRTSTRRA